MLFRSWPETTVLVPVGAVRVIEFVADAPGDWALHCHITHHVMNQMGHDAPNLIGADVRGVDKKVGRIVPGYMTMGATGMGDMMEMRQPDNSISMLGGDGPFGMIDMGGMFTVVKVRAKLTGAKDRAGTSTRRARSLPRRRTPTFPATASRPDQEHSR